MTKINCRGLEDLIWQTLSLQSVSLSYYRQAGVWLTTGPMFPEQLILAKLNCRPWGRHSFLFLTTLTNTVMPAVGEGKARRAEALEGPRTVGTGARQAEAGILQALITICRGRDSS